MLVIVVLALTTGALAMVIALDEDDQPTPPVNPEAPTEPEPRGQPTKQEKRPRPQRRPRWPAAKFETVKKIGDVTASVGARRTPTGKIRLRLRVRVFGRSYAPALYRRLAGPARWLTPTVKGPSVTQPARRARMFRRNRWLGIFVRRRSETRYTLALRVPTKRLLSVSQRARR
jgi:hypothetical protein